MTVTDTRGTNVGWTLTGQLADDFVNATPGYENGTTATASHNTIPASNLSWIPSVSLAVPTTVWPVTWPQVRRPRCRRRRRRRSPSQPIGGGGGTWQADAALSLKVPSYVNKGVYSATLDLVLG